MLPRRELLRRGLFGLAAAFVGRTVGGCEDQCVLPANIDDGGTELPARMVPPRPFLYSRIADIGPLGAPDRHGIRLPDGFRSRALARSGQLVGDSSYAWHGAPDGGATFGTEDGGFIYVSNSEVSGCAGGAGALRFDASGVLLTAYPILSGTDNNCSGGRTPWHTWLSCEESDRGRVCECDPWGEASAAVRPALGAFRHEAVAFDDVRGHLYMTEDESDGGLYRFVPDASSPLGRPDLSRGTLEIATVDTSGQVSWSPVPNPAATSQRTRHQVEARTPFDGGEGIWYHAGVVYFTTKGDNRVWTYEVASDALSVLYDGEAVDDPPLRGVDNITVSCCGDVLVAEDGGSMQIVAILPSGELKPILQIEGQDRSEITGPAFDPSGNRLFFSSQRGDSGSGVTYWIEGPFHMRG